MFGKVPLEMQAEIIRLGDNEENMRLAYQRALYAEKEMLRVRNAFLGITEVPQSSYSRLQDLETLITQFGAPLQGPHHDFFKKVGKKYARCREFRERVLGTMPNCARALDTVREDRAWRV